MQKLIVLVISLAILLVSTSIGTMSENKENQPILILDKANELQVPKNFRTTSYIVNSSKVEVPSMEGLLELHESGSSQFSELEFTQMLPYMSGHIYIVDLRQESHGFLDGTAVSWYGKHNWANIGKSLVEVQEDEQARLNATPNLVYYGKNRTIAENLEKPISHALTEEQLVTSYGVEYFRIPVTDHIRPNDENVDRFIQFYKSLPPNAWLHFHCHAGHGRTTTFMVMYDILRNGKNISLDDIIARQALIGSLDLREIPSSKKEWEQNAYKERAKFIKDFYNFATTTGNDLPITWSEWIKQQ